MNESYRTKKRSDRIVMTDEARVLKLLRSEAKLSMRAVADAIGVSDTYIAHPLLRINSSIIFGPFFIATSTPLV